jgi:uncharacterized lipoprotein YajG
MVPSLTEKREQMTRKTSAAAIALLFIAACHDFAQSQPPSHALPTPSQATLVIDIQDLVTYLTDVSDPSKYATNPESTRETL